jgi:preprotein translocase subunit YajC
MSMLPVTVLASATPLAQAAAAPTGSQPIIMNIVFIGSMVVIFWFLILRPQKKQQDQRKKMLEAIQRGDRVLTTGGLYGTVKDIKGEVMVIMIAENVKVEVAKGAIQAVTQE